MNHGLGIRAWRERWPARWRYSRTGDGDGGGGDGGAGGDDDWREGIPEELRGDPAIQNFKDVTDLTKGFLETKKLMGQKGLSRPEDNAGAEEWDAFYKAIGRPDAPEGYGLEMPADEKVPKGGRWLYKRRPTLPRRRCPPVG